MLHDEFTLTVSVYLPACQSSYVQRKDLLQLMLDASQDGDSQLEEGHVLINSLSVLFAGHETTSSALSFTSYLLALNPEVQEKLAQEVSSYLQENPVSLSCSVFSPATIALQLTTLSSIPQRTRHCMRQLRSWSTLTMWFKRPCGCTLLEHCKCCRGTGPPKTSSS